MAIRIRNLDLNAPGLKRSTHTYIGAISTTVINRPIFVAPVDCVVDTIDFYAQSQVSCNTSNTFKIWVYQAGASASTSSLLQSISVTTSAATNTYSANQQIRLTPSSVNSLTAGTVLLCQISAVCQGALGETMAVVNWTPLKHRATR